MTAYHKFIEHKTRKARQFGFDVDEDGLNPHLFDWQRDVVVWALKRGRAALFEECGLGKTLQQLEWARHVIKKTKLPVMLHSPVGVRHQTLGEAKKFGIADQVNVIICDEQEDIRPESICIANYEKLHKFDLSEFGGVVLDESSILKNYTGKTKKQLIEAYKDTPYRLACTATPAPNDHMELGTHAEFLGVCTREDMLSKYFIHDGSDTAKWRLKGHGERDFWEWIASWAVCISKPSDIGGDDSGFILPRLHIDRQLVHVDPGVAPNGYLFNTSGLSATNIHEEKRLTCNARCNRAIELVKQKDTPCVIWCDTNYEADQLCKMLPEAVDIRGTHKASEKESKLAAFSDGDSPYIITKPSIAGFGMNWQHCNRQVFAGLSYSFEAYYQAVRRCWRFGQTQPVTIHIVLADSESGIESAIARKETDYQMLKSGMAVAMAGSTKRQLHGEDRKSVYEAELDITLPTFMESLCKL